MTGEVMTLDEFVSQGWMDHATDAEGVMARLNQGVGMLTEARQLPALAGLITHVAGEHLGRWGDGITLLEALTATPAFDSSTPEGKAVIRSQAILHRCDGNRAEEERCFAASKTGGATPEASDRIRVLSVAASAMLGQKRLVEAARDFDAAVALASYGPGSNDPAARSLAVTGNNLAIEFENRPTLSREEIDLMLRAARAGREFWAIAGSWKEVERAEYRLAMSHIKAGNAETALVHARRCLAVVEENGTDPGEAFFAQEAVARAQLAAEQLGAARDARAAMAELLPKVTDESFRKYCAGELAKLDEALAGAKAEQTISGT
jgi:hypothetical protein